MADWLANPKIKNDPNIISKKIPKTDAEWFDLMERQAEKKSSSKRQKKTKVSQTPAPEIIDQKDGSEDDPKDLDKKVPWPVPFPDDKEHREVWQRGIQTAKDMFKVDGAEYTFSTWFAMISSKDIRNILLTAKSEEEVAMKAKEEYLRRGWRTDSEYTKKSLHEKIEATIREYKAEDKGSPEWMAFIEHSFEKDEMYDAGTGL